jgi:signal transduction histidine kinase
MTLRIGNWGPPAIAASLILLGIASWFSCRSVQSLIEAAHARDHTVAVLTKLLEIHGRLADAEASSRGYVITGQADYRLAARAAAARVEPSLEELRVLIADNVDLQLPLEVLIPQTRARLLLLDQAVPLTTTEANAGAIAATKQGQPSLDIINRLVVQMQDAEMSVLQGQDRGAGVRTRYAALATVAASLLAISLVGGAGLISLRREVILQRQTQEGLLEAHDPLEQRGADRTPIQSLVNVAPRREAGGHENAANALPSEVVPRRQATSAQWPADVGILVKGIAHDLNNLMTPILMSVQLLKRDRNAEQRQMLLETAQASVERAAEMIKKLLAYAGGGPQRRAPVPIQDIIAELEARLELPKTIEVHCELSSDLWLVSGDAMQLAQALTDLCLNARDAMPAGGILTISACNTTLTDSDTPEASSGLHVLVTVADTGSGMLPAVVDKIFDPFFTTKECGHGTGLGLSRVLGIVQGHKGFIRVSSKPGHGTRMAIYLPVLERPEGFRDESPELPTGRGQQILVVDDESSILQTASMMLEAHGYRTLTAGDGNLAIAIFKEKRGEIAAIVLDMMMPVVDGPATIAALRALDPRVRIIAASGLQATSGAAIAAGARTFLPKPFSGGQLLSAVQRVLQPG